MQVHVYSEVNNDVGFKKRRAGSAGWCGGGHEDDGGCSREAPEETPRVSISRPSSSWVSTVAVAMQGAALGTPPRVFSQIPRSVVSADASLRVA